MLQNIIPCVASWIRASFSYAVEIKLLNYAHFPVRNEILKRTFTQCIFDAENYRELHCRPCNTQARMHSRPIYQWQLGAPGCDQQHNALQTTARTRIHERAELPLATTCSCFLSYHNMVRSMRIVKGQDHTNNRGMRSARCTR